jgi:hypothetical protein
MPLDRKKIEKMEEKTPIKLILSSQAANKLQKTVETRTELEIDVNTWRVDWLSLRKKQIFLITNEKTLYTYISPVKEGLKGLLTKVSSDQISDDKTQEIIYIKFQNRNVIGSMTSLKNCLTIRLLNIYPSVAPQKSIV